MIINIISDEVHRLVNKVIKIIPRISGNCMQRSLIIYHCMGRVLVSAKLMTYIYLLICMLQTVIKFEKN